MPDNQLTTRNMENWCITENVLDVMISHRQTFVYKEKNLTNVCSCRPDKIQSIWNSIALVSKSISLMARLMKGCVLGNFLQYPWNLTWIINTGDGYCHVVFPLSLAKLKVRYKNKQMVNKYEICESIWRRFFSWEKRCYRYKVCFLFRLLHDVENMYGQFSSQTVWLILN